MPASGHISGRRRNEALLLMPDDDDDDAAAAAVAVVAYSRLETLKSSRSPPLSASPSVHSHGINLDFISL